jgi:hypothetical protein
MSFITKRHIPRRTFLRGAGATLALPLLDAMLPASTALAQTAAGDPKQRFVGIFFPHGMGPVIGNQPRRSAPREASVHPRVVG